MTAAPEIFLEMVTEKIGDRIIASTVRPATEAEIELGRQLHALGKCPHNLVHDEPGWLYDFRYCAICGQGLGIV